MTADKDKRAFVTGASGFIGGHLVDSLLRRGFEVRALVHRNPLPSRDKLEIVTGDICDRGTLDGALEGTGFVFHLASALGSAVIGREEFRRINVLGTQCVLDAARRSGIRRFIHISSAGVFGKVRRGEIAAESSPPAPITVYDKTKLEGERIAIGFAREGMDTVVLRPGWAYGPGDRRTFKLIKAVCSGRFIMITRGTDFQTPVFVEDLVQGILLAAERGKKGEIYHLAGGEITPVRDMIRAIGRTCGKKPARFYLPLLPARLAAVLLEAAYALRSKEAPFSRSKLSFFVHSKPLSIAKARRELGYAPEVSFQDGIVRTVSWYNNQGWLP